MDIKPLPARPSLEQYKKQAKDLVRAYKTRNLETIQRVQTFHPHAARFLNSETLQAKFTLADAQLIIAREHGYESWPKFAQQIEKLAAEYSAAAMNDPVAAFIIAATVPRNESHASGTIAAADAIVAAHPEIATSNIYAASILGDDASVCRFLAQNKDKASATTKGGPHGWDALTYLCFSRYLRLDRNRSEGFVRAAEALLEAGASANTGFYEKNPPHPDEFESVLYGAAGVAHHAELTRVLLSRGADANDHEVVYHSPESYDNAALKILVESDKLKQDSLAAMLLRKHDWHDYEGARFLLEHGADPNRITQWHRTPMHQAVLRDNSLEMFELLLQHGADPRVLTAGKSTIEIGARRGRADLLALFAERGISIELHGVEKLIAACATNDVASIRPLLAGEPALVSQLQAEGGKLLAEFAGNGNSEGVRNLLYLGVNVEARFREGDGYWEIAKESTALHVAAWRASHETVKLLIARGAPVNAEDASARTPLALAVRACVDSYWKDRRSPESVRALLEAGASVRGINFPSGYAEVDELLRDYALPKSGR